MSVDNHSFPYRERLHTAGQFQRVFDQSMRVGNEKFTVLFRENTVLYPRIGIVIAKRNVKRAVDRSLIKRIIRESFRLHKARLPASDFVVIVKRPAIVVRRDELRRQITKLWKTLLII